MLTKEKCPDCGCNDFFHDREKGELICRGCSMVVDDSMLDFGRDTRSFDDDGDIEYNSRVGAPFDPRITDNISTNIGNTTDIKRLSPKTKRLMRRIKKKNQWTSNAIEHNLNKALSMLRSYASLFEIPSRAEKEAAVIYRRAIEKRLTTRRSIELVVVASLYIACRIQDIPKAFNEFIEKTDVNKKFLSRTVKLILAELKIKLEPVKPSDHVYKFASALNLSPKTQTKALNMIKKLGKNQALSGLSPLSVAATSLYIAGLMNNEKRRQHEVAQVAGITETTLRNRCKQITKVLGIKKL